jgi:MATE family multidrug resistance protein
VKLPLSIWFTFGGAGLPAMGLVGCGWATLCVNWAMLGCAVWLLRSSPFYRGYRLWQRIEPPDWHHDPPVRAHGGVLVAWRCWSR